MSRLDDLLTTHRPTALRFIAWPIVIFLGAFFVWSYFARLDEVAVASGEVVPIDRVKVIQHLEGGIIEKIFVDEGTVVKVDTPLVQLNLGSTVANRRELQVRLDALELKRARLRAEAAGNDDIEFPEESAGRQPALVDAERETFKSRRRELDSTVQVLREQQRQRSLQVEELEARRRSTSASLKLARERLKMSQSLLSAGLQARMEHLQLAAEVEKLEGDLQGLIPAIPRARAAVAEETERIAEEKNRFTSKALEDLGDVTQSIARTEELLTKASEQHQRATIRSPINGIVKNMRYHTIGGVVRPGEAIMEIVPTGSRLVIEAKLSPVDRGYVEPGQAAVVKISTYDFARYGGLDGKVVRVAPDVSTDERQMPYFPVVVETDKSYLGDKKGDLPITPGMQATVDIHTGTKSVMEYLIKPVLKLREEAFRER